MVDGLEYNKEHEGQQTIEKPVRFTAARELFLGCQNRAVTSTLLISHIAIFLWRLRERETVLLSGGLTRLINFRQTSCEVQKEPQYGPVMPKFPVEDMQEIAKNMSGQSVH